MAILGIDHLVIAVADPDAAATGLEQPLGLAFTGGGRHVTAGTWNRLAFLGVSCVVWRQGQRDAERRPRAA